MAQCAHYRVDVRRHDASAAVPHFGRGKTIIVKTPWCAHAHSPAPHALAVEFAGACPALECGGALSRCPIQSQRR